MIKSVVRGKRRDSGFLASDGHRYVISRTCLGSGGFGSVYVGRRDDGGEVAIKRLSHSPPNNRELEIAIKLGEQRAPYLLAPVAWARQRRDLLLVMPRAVYSLAAHLDDRGDPLTIEEQRAVLRDVTRALAELYRAGIVHRDIKPANVLFHGGVWCLADFGISRDLDAPTASLTFQNAGTFPYLAPERWRGEPASHLTDLYALGCLAYEVCTGRHPFGGSLAQLQHEHLHATVPTPSADPGLSRWILQLLEKDPARRFENAEIALAALGPGQLGLARR
jgi:serine/threonine-protein kinase